MTRHRTAWRCTGISYSVPSAVSTRPQRRIKGVRYEWHEDKLWKARRKAVFGLVTPSSVRRNALTSWHSCQVRFWSHVSGNSSVSTFDLRAAEPLARESAG